MTNIHDELPTKKEVSEAIPCAVRVTKRNNQYKVTVPFANYFEACQIAESFGCFNSIAKQAIVEIKMA